MAGRALQLIQPQWPAPATVRAAATTRAGGVSRGPYASLNLGDHVADDPAAVAANRAVLRQRLELPGEPAWLTQVHGVAVAEAGRAAPGTRADASIASRPGVICAVLTADCLPVLFCDRDGRHVAAAHAGWRGLAAGVLEATVDALARAGAPAGSLLAWLGPAIGPGAYEVGEEVRSASLNADASAGPAFAPSAPGHWYLDLYAAARQRLARAGVTAIYGGDFCTHQEADRFFSHRRDGVTGRQATLIWLA